MLTLEIDSLISLRSSRTPTFSGDVIFFWDELASSVINGQKPSKSWQFLGCFGVFCYFSVFFNKRFLLKMQVSHKTAATGKREEGALDQSRQENQDLLKCQHPPASSLSAHKTTQIDQKDSFQRDFSFTREKWPYSERVTFGCE